jgi:dTDP-4-amino-4,6-dideoxy-D-galactose acyltransferase
LVQKQDHPISLKGFTQTYVDHKLTFIKEIRKHTANVIRTKCFSSPTESEFVELCTLAFLSGQYSRFKCDPKLDQSYFEKLYIQWVKNSISDGVSKGLFYIKVDDFMAGFVTYTINHLEATIGLIAVDPAVQGQGIGGQLIQHLTTFLNENGVLKIFVTTQIQNQQAISFYKKMGFELSHRTITKHLWNENTIQ